MNKKIIILKSGDFKPNIYKDFMGIIREATDDKHQIGCHNDMGNKFHLIQRDKELVITGPINSGLDDLEFRFSPKDVITEHQYVLLGAVFPVENSKVLTVADIFKGMTVMYLDKESGAVRDIYTDEIVENTSTFIYPMAIVNRVNDDLYTVGINGEVLYVDCLVNLADDDYMMSGVWGIDPATLTVSTVLFDSKLEGQYTRVGDFYHVNSQYLTLRLGPYALLPYADANFNTGDIKFDTNLPYQTSSDGSYVTIDFREAQPGMIQYFKVYLPYDKKTEQFSSCRGDLPLVEFNFVAH